MKIIPAIDLINKQCVRLTKGNYESKTVYKVEPVDIAKSYQEQGSEYMHVVDLEGAKSGVQKQTETIAEIINATNLKIQVGGGVREQRSIETLLDLSVDKVILGSVAVKSMSETCKWFEMFSAEKICLAFDVTMTKQGPMLMTEGWQESSSVLLWEIVEAYCKVGLQHVLCTDISKDGMLAGPNFFLYQEFLERFPNLKLQASGGVRAIEDLIELRKLGVDAVIIGKALYENKFTLTEALAC